MGLRGEGEVSLSVRISACKQGVFMWWQRRHNGQVTCRWLRLYQPLGTVYGTDVTDVNVSTKTARPPSLCLSVCVCLCLCVCVCVARASRAWCGRMKDERRQRETPSTAAAAAAVAKRRVVEYHTQQRRASPPVTDRQTDRRTVGWRNAHRTCTSTSSRPISSSHSPALNCVKRRLRFFSTKF